jgi:hypothetical protein
MVRSSLFTSHAQRTVKYSLLKFGRLSLTTKKKKKKEKKRTTILLVKCLIEVPGTSN